MKDEKWLRPCEVAERLNISLSGSYDLIALGHFKVFRVSGAKKGRLRVSEPSVERYIENRVAIFELENGLLEAE